MDSEIENFMRLYDEPIPSISLYRDICNAKDDTAREMSNIVVRAGEMNPIEIVLESMVSINAEKISKQKLTHSANKIMINQEIRNESAGEIVRLLGNDLVKIKQCHNLWLKKLKIYLRNLSQINEKLSLNEVIPLVSSQFRISTKSTIHAICSVLR